jgi:hypothetical protein
LRLHYFVRYLRVFLFASSLFSLDLCGLACTVRGVSSRKRGNMIIINDAEQHLSGTPPGEARSESCDRRMTAKHRNRLLLTVAALCFLLHDWLADLTVGTTYRGW